MGRSEKRQKWKGGWRGAVIRERGGTSAGKVMLYRRATSTKQGGAWP